MQAPTITVILATYNRAGLLRRAVQSVQNQSYDDFVLAVYDNASTDETPGMMRELASRDSRIRYHRHGSNIGSAQNFLFGLREVSTDCFTFLSDDDLMLPNLLARAARYLQEFPDARFAAGGILEMSDEGELVFAPQAFWSRDGLFEPPDGLDLMLSGYHPSWTTIVFRSSVVREVGEFRLDMPNVFDVDFTFRIACRYPYVIFREPSGIFVRHPASGGEFADVSVIEQYESMKDRLLSDDRISSGSKAIIEECVTRQLSKRVTQVAVKQLLRREPQLTQATLRRYHREYPATALSCAIGLTAAFGSLCPTMLSALAPLEAMRRTGRAGLSVAAAKKNRVPNVDAALYRHLLQ